MLECKKMGRPTESIKARDIRVRVPESLYKAIYGISVGRKQTVSETVRQALEDVIKEGL